MERAIPTYVPKECACGCETMFTPAGARSSFAPGHKPSGGQHKASSKATTKAVRKTAAELGIKAPKAEPLCGLVDLGKLKCDVLAKLAAIELIEKTLRES